jgi:hypothetical protein
MTNITRPDHASQTAQHLGINTIRYGLPAVMIVAGLVVLVVSPGGFGVDGFAMAVGSGLSVLLINFMYRVSLASNRDRDDEEAARKYLQEHGRWPDE